MRLATLWLLTLPLLVVGLLAGHAAAYRVAIGDEHARAHALEESGHAYLAYAPIAVAVCLAVVALAFLRFVVAPAHGRTPRTPSGLLAALPPLCFLAQEALERYLTHGHLTWSLLVQPAIAVGLLAQIPIALAALLLARLLCRAGEALGLALRAALRDRRSHEVARPRVPLSLGLRHGRVLALGHAERAPPVLPSL